MVANINKFKDDVQKYKESLESQLLTLKKDFRLLNIIKTYLNDGNYEVLFEFLNPEFELDDTLVNTIKALKYFHDNNKMNLPQFKNLLESISSCELFISLNNNKEEIEEKVRNLENNIIICEDMLTGNNYDPVMILKILDNYNYTREEILGILSNIAKSMCPSKVETKEEEQKIVFEEVEEITETNVYDSELVAKKKEILDSNKELFDLIDKLITDNYEMIQKYSSDPKLSGYLKLTFEILQEAEKDINELNYKEISFVMLINKLIENKKAFVDMILDATGEDDLDYLKDEPANLRKQYEFVLESAPVISTEEEMLQGQGKKIIYLTDDNGNICFNQNDLVQNPSIIDKLNRGLLDYKRGKKPSHIKGVRNNNYIVRINSTGNDYCSYIELANDIILFITVGSYDFVIDNSIQLANKFDEKIEFIREMAATELENLIAMNKETVNIPTGEGRKG